MKPLTSALTATLLAGLAAAATAAPEAPADAASAPAMAASAPAMAASEAVAPAVDAALSAKFATIEPGMTASEVNQLLGRTPEDHHTYETGKRFIPFYFGSDAVRLAAVYKGLGCLTFAAGYRFQNHGIEWKDFDGTVIKVDVDATTACYKP